MNDHMGLVPMSAEITMFYTDFTASLAFAAHQERERIVELLDSLDISFTGYEDKDYAVGDALDLIELIREGSE